jgi:hypothetical protein
LLLLAVQQVVGVQASQAGIGVLNLLPGLVERRPVRRFATVACPGEQQPARQGGIGVGIDETLQCRARNTAEPALELLVFQVGVERIGFECLGLRVAERGGLQQRGFELRPQLIRVVLCQHRAGLHQ